MRLSLRGGNRGTAGDSLPFGPLSLCIPTGLRARSVFCHQASFFAIFAVIYDNPAPISMFVNEAQARAALGFGPTVGVRRTKSCHAGNDFSGRQSGHASQVLRGDVEVPVLIG